MQFNFGIPSQVSFGAGVSKNLGEVLKELGAKKVFCVYDQGVKLAGIVDNVLVNCKESNIEVVEYSNVLPNPPDIILEEGADLAKKEKVDAIVAVGGGSPIDAAKAINVLITNPGPIHQYEGVNLVKNRTLPLIAIPTTAGTGSEVTSVSVITDTKGEKKMVIVGNNIGADFALVDPELTIALPPAVTAATGMDALTHAIESYISKFASVPSEINSLKAIELIYNNLEGAYQNGSNIEARTNMLLGSMLAAYAFNSALLGLVHGIAHPLSVYCNLPHGVANACTLPYVMAFNGKDKNVQRRYREIAKVIDIDVEGLSDAEVANRTIEAIKSLSTKVDIPTLSEAGVKREQFDILAEATLREDISLAANPREVNKEDVLNLLDLAF